MWIGRDRCNCLTSICSLKQIFLTSLSHKRLGTQCEHFQRTGDRSPSCATSQGRPAFLSTSPHLSPTGRTPFTASNQPRCPHVWTARSATRARLSPHAEAAAFSILSDNHPDEARLGLQPPFEGGRPAEAELVAASTARSPGGGSNGLTGCLLSLERRGGLGAWTVP
jgi:hypothetical protein